MSLEGATHISGLDSAQPDGLDDVSVGDDHLRMLKLVLKNDLPLPGKFIRSVAKTANYSLVATDYLSSIKVTAAGVTISSGVAASVLGDAFMALIIAQGGSVVFDPNSTETVNGLASITIPINSSAWVLCDGSNWTAIVGSGLVPGIGTTITTSSTLTAADARQTRTVTDGPSDVTLPSTALLSIGDTVAVKSLTYKRTRVQAASSGTIDGASGLFTVPAYEMAEFTVVGSNAWIISRAPTSFVGEIRALRHNLIPAGWLAEDGTTYDQVLYGGLFAAIGATWNRGDEAVGTFRLANSQGRGLVGSGTGALTTRFLPGDINLAANTISVPSTPGRWPQGMMVRFNLIAGIAPGTVPGAALVDNALLFVVRSVGGALLPDGTIKLATTAANAANEVTIDLTDAGTGTFSLTHTLSGRSVGDYFGEENHATGLYEMPSHDHAVAGQSTWTGGALVGVHVGGTINRSSFTGGTLPINVQGPTSVARFMVKA